MLLSSPAPPVGAVTTGPAQNYLVTYKAGASTQDAAAQIQGAGGALVYSYQQIGVVVARSNRSDFAANLQSAPNIEDVAGTAGAASQVKDDQLNASGADTTTTDTAPKGASLSDLQWDMRQIHALEAHSITKGSKSVLVGDIDTGADYTHPDLNPNIDFANSVSCIGGSPNREPSAWKDDNGHGTHTAGTIAAARNGIGVVGVAPNVRLAAIKAGDTNWFFFPDAVVCAFMWAGSHHINVTNNSYFADPFYWNCPNDPTQAAILEAETRAINFATDHGVFNVAAEGNFSDDLAHPTQDRQSPDDTTPVTRPVNNDCKIVPVEIQG